MIQTIFPTNVFIKDYELSEDWNSSLSVFIRAHFANAVSISGNYDITSDEAYGVFTEENLQASKELRELREMFVDGFYQLSQSFKTNKEKKLTKEEVSNGLEKTFGRLPFMKKGDVKRLHTHSDADAFGIFYLNDVDNQKDGGQLVLHDPSFNSLLFFRENRTMQIPTKKHRLIIVPSSVWHEVYQYLGEEERITVVVNLRVNFD
jgi:oxalate decarboxylase/phosphoglucose isomerase-like protein (cupin superfamily)